jgi:hypothetical protein
MEKICLGMLLRCFDAERLQRLQSLTPSSTPKALGESLPNAERGVFHIQNAEWWSFHNLEYVSVLVISKALVTNIRQNH